MKRIALILALLLITSNCYGAVVGQYATGNSVSFNTVGVVVTLNSAIRELHLINTSADGDVFINVRGTGWNSDKTLYTEPATFTGSINSEQGMIIVPAGKQIKLEVSTDIFGYIGDDFASGTLYYTGIGDISQP